MDYIFFYSYSQTIKHNAEKCYVNENYLIGFSMVLPFPSPGNWVGRCWEKTDDGKCE